MPAARRPTACQTEHSEIARFGSAARENDFMRFDVQQRGQFVPRIVQSRTRVSTRCVNTRRITKVPTKIRQHHFARRVAQWRRCVVIEIYHRVTKGNPLDKMDKKFYLQQQ